jgi:predicted Mrr-cat superfamily restriction endonuclease
MRKELPANTVVFEPTAKAIKKGAMTADMRLVFNGDGTIAMWKGDELIGSDVPYTSPDSHCQATSETVPEILYAHPEEARRIEVLGMRLPFRIVRR